MPISRAAADYAKQFGTHQFDAPRFLCIIKDIVDDGSGNREFVVTLDFHSCAGGFHVPEASVDVVEVIGMRRSPDGQYHDLALLTLQNLDASTFEGRLLAELLKHGWGVDVTIFSHGSNCDEIKENIQQRFKYYGFGRCDHPTKADAEVVAAGVLSDLVARTGCLGNHTIGADEIEYYRDTPFGRVYWTAWLSYAGCDDPFVSQCNGPTVPESRHTCASCAK